MEVAIVCFVISALSIIPITVMTLRDLMRTRKWVRTTVWRSLLAYVEAGNTSQVRALYIMHRSDLHAWQRSAIEAYLDGVERDRVLAKLADAGREWSVRLGTYHDSAWTWTEGAASPGEPGGNPEPK